MPGPAKAAAKLRLAEEAASTTKQLRKDEQNEMAKETASTTSETREASKKEAEAAEVAKKDIKKVDTLSAELAKSQQKVNAIGKAIGVEKQKQEDAHKNV